MKRMKSLLRKIKSLEGGAKATSLVYIIAAIGIITYPLKFKGLGRACLLLNKFVNTSSHFITLELTENNLFRFHLTDYYWSRMLFNPYHMEPEILETLKLTLNKNTAFIDCGANLGLWSIYATNLIGDPKKVLSIEASPETYKELLENSKLNNNFPTVNCAAHATDGGSLLFYQDVRHASSKVVSNASHGSNTISVEKSSLDSLAIDRNLTIPGRLIIKLDVEGLEKEVLQGSHNILTANDSLIIYEDHANDVDCISSKYILEDLGFEISPAANPSLTFKSLDEVKEYKSKRKGGLNFIGAKKSSYLLQELLSKTIKH